MRGGKRKGSGRKPAKNKKLPYGTRLRPDQIEWLRKQKNAAREIEIALDYRINDYDYPVKAKKVVRICD